MLKQCDHIIFALKSLDNEVKRMLHKSAIADNSANLTGMQFAFLGFLAEHKSTATVIQKDLEEHFHIRRSTVSEMLRLLEEKALIFRESDPQDARIKRVSLTEKGKHLHKQAISNMQAVEERLTHSLTAQEKSEFMRIVQKILESTKD